MLKRAIELRSALDHALDEFKTRIFVGEAGGGAVRVEVTGDLDVQDVSLSDAVLRAGDGRRVEKLLLAALSDALSDSKRARKATMDEISGGIELPDL